MCMYTHSSIHVCIGNIYIYIYIYIHTHTHAHLYTHAPLLDMELHARIQGRREGFQALELVWKLLAHDFLGLSLCSML